MATTLESLPVKYRPNSILGLVGQDAVIAKLQGMVKKGVFPSTILLAGESGCGKTTTARIIARTLNCKNLDLKTYEPCGECQPCKLGDGSPDYTEMNIADTRGIDDVRSICQAAKSLPIISPFKVIVMDECHMLTVQAANALLKSIEDSPKKTIWILATTNPEKLLPAIVGRCNQFNLKAIPPEAMAKRLRIISKREGVNMKELDGGSEIIDAIVDLSNGRMRDAISILESALFSLAGNKNVDAKTVITNFSNTGEADLEKTAANILYAIVSGDLKILIKNIRGSGNCRGVLQKLRWTIQYYLDKSVNMARYEPYAAKLLSPMLRKDGKSLPLSTLIKLQQILVDLEERFNRMSIDESVMLLSILGQFTVDNVKK
jgi:DNA polymerase III subunit gamma/tau